MTTHRIPRGGKIVTYTEYKLQPSDTGKGLRGIAHERLNDESLFVDILRMTSAANNQGIPWYEEITDKNTLVNNWTLLLPPGRPSPQPVPPPSVQFGTFSLTQETNIRTSARVEAGNIFLVGRIQTVYKYDMSSKHTDANGMTWVDVSPTDFHGKAVPGAKYWICVREGNISRTNPPL